MKIFSLNLFIRPKPIKSDGHDYRRPRLELLHKRISGYDVVCFQELFMSKSNRSMTNPFIERMEEYGYTFNMFGPNTECCRFVNGGLAIFAKI